MTPTEYYKLTSLTLGSLAAATLTTVPFAFVLLFAIVLDCLSAFDLSRRLRKKHPDEVTGKFRSEYALRMLKTFLEMYGVILLVHFVEVYVLPMHQWHMANYVAAFLCGVELWSVLENRSTENPKSWARLLQRFMVSKAERHFDIKLDRTSNEKEENEDGIKNKSSTL